MAWVLRAKSVENLQFRSNGGRLTQNSRISGRLHQPFFFSKTTLNDLSFRIKNLDRFFFHFVTYYSFDRQTYRQPCIHSIQCGKNVSIQVFPLHRPGESKVNSISFLPTLWHAKLRLHHFGVCQTIYSHEINIYCDALHCVRRITNQWTRT